MVEPINIKSKELIIDKSDEKFNAYIISLLNIKKFKRNMKLISKNIYSLKNKSVSEKTTLYFNENCDKIDSIRLYQNEYKISINNISIFIINYVIIGLKYINQMMIIINTKFQCNTYIITLFLKLLNVAI